MQMEEEQQQQLIPELPNDISVDCLLRVPFRFHSGLKSVCRSWHKLFSNPSSYQRRKIIGKSEELACFVQAIIQAAAEEETMTAGDDDGDDHVDAKKKSGAAVKARPLYGITLYNVTEKTWDRMVNPLGFGNEIPLFCQCVAVPGKLILIGGWDPNTLESIASIYIYDFHRNSWRRGASMSTARSFFACAAAMSESSEWVVYVAGGHDNQKNALKSAEIYHVDSDAWEDLPPMTQARDECQGMVLRGCAFDHHTQDNWQGTAAPFLFYVISGYGTESQGRFCSSIEYLHPLRKVWIKEENVWSFPSSSPRSSTLVENNENKSLWWFLDGSSGKVREYEGKGKGWKVVGSIPKDVLQTTTTTTTSSSCLPCSCVLQLHPHSLTPSSLLLFLVNAQHCTLNLESSNSSKWQWTLMDAPRPFSGFVYSATSMHL